MAHPRIGIALGSGAARGWAHIGVLSSLIEAGVEPEIVCGTSIGAFVGAAYVAGRLSELKRWAETVTWREIVGLLDVRLSGGGLIDGTAAVEFLQELGVGQLIESYTKRYAAIATDLVTGREIWLDCGPIHQAVRASIALPGIFSPVRIQGKWLIDGGLCNPVPVSVCRALGADMIIAVNLNGDLLGRRFQSQSERAPATASSRLQNELLDRVVSRLPAGLRDQAAQVAQQLLPKAPSTLGYFDVLANSINIMQDHITRSRLAGEPPHVLLVPRLRDFGLLEFNRAEEAIAEGRSCVEQALPVLRRFLAS